MIGLALCAAASAAPAGAQASTALASATTMSRAQLQPPNSDDALVRAADKNQRELQKLRAEHENRIRKLEEELLEKLEKAEAELGRAAAIEDRPDRLREKRVQFRQKSDAAYATYDQKLAEQTRRYHDKRAQISNR